MYSDFLKFPNERTMWTMHNPGEGNYVNSAYRVCDNCTIYGIRDPEIKNWIREHGGPWRPPTVRYTGSRHTLFGTNNRSGFFPQAITQGDNPTYYFDYIEEYPPN